MTNTVAVDASEVIVTVLDNSVNVNVCENITEVVVGETGPQGAKGASLLSGSNDPLSAIGEVGDLYINVSTGFLFGPKTELGWGIGVVLGGFLGIEDVGYAHYQTFASNVWTIDHGLGFIPNITVVDLDGNVIDGDYKYQGNTVIVTFSESITGAAFLS